MSKPQRDPRPPQAPPKPWYAGGLRFTCQRSGRCCAGFPGYVWVSEDEQRALAEHLGMDLAEFLVCFTREAQGKVTLAEKNRDECVFYSRREGCEVYEARPTQCRSFPFWPSILKSRRAWTEADLSCPGMGQGKLWTLEEIEALRALHDDDPWDSDV